MNAPTYINSTHRALARNPGGLTLEEIAGKIRAKAKKAAEQVRELHDLGMIQTTEEAGQPVYKLKDEPAAATKTGIPVLVEKQAVAEVGDTDVVELGDSEGGEADAPAADADGWIPWVATADSVCPVPDRTFVRVRLENGIEGEDTATSISWHTNEEFINPVVAYKIIAKAPADFATTPELQYLAPEDYADMPPADPDFLAQANRALGEQLEAANNLVTARGHTIASLRYEVADLRARLDAVTQQSIADTDALTAQIEHLRAELAERDSHLHKITSDTGRSDIAQRLIDHNDDRLYHEADMLMYEASDAITMLEHERDQLRAELETARAEAIALKTLEGAMPGFGTAHDAQRIASLTAELQALRTSSANAINEADRLRAELATERQAREALQEQGDDAVDVKDAAVGYLVRVPKRRPMMRTKPESARAAALSAVRSGAAHAEVLAVVPVGTARRGAEWRGA